MTHDKIDRQYVRGATTRWSCICGFEGYSEQDVDDHVLAAIDGSDDPRGSADHRPRR